MTNEILIENSRSWFPNLGEIWDHRLLLTVLVKRNIKLRYKQTLLGILWVLIQPLALSGIFTLLFSKIIAIPTGEVPYICFAVAGVSIWQFFSRSVAESSVSLSSFSNVISKVYFPRTLVPLASIITALFDFIVVLLLTLILIYLLGGTLPLRSLWGIPCFVGLTFVVSFGLGLLLSSLNVIFRDVQHMVPFILQLGLYVSPVFYPTSIISEKWKMLYYCNPMVSIIEGFRWALFPSSPSPEPLGLTITIITSFTLLFMGCLAFHSVEHNMIDRI